MVNGKPADWTLPKKYGSPDDPRHPESGAPICGNYKRGGKLNRFGDPVCLAHRATGRRKCRVHGGETPRGIASPHYEGKGWGKDMPTRLIPNFERAVTDPGLFNLVNETALLDARLNELLGKLDTGEAGALWKMMREQADIAEQARIDGVAARRVGDTRAELEASTALAAALNEMIQLARRGATEYARWRELYEIADRKRRMVETVRKVRRDSMKMVTDVELMLTMQRLGDVIAQNVSDPDALTAISAAITTMVQGRLTPSGT